MSEYDAGSPTLQVSVYEDRVLVTRILCETADEAAAIATVWEEHPGYTCAVEDLAETHDANDVLAPEPEDLVPDEEYRSGSTQ